MSCQTNGIAWCPNGAQFTMGPQEIPYCKFKDGSVYRAWFQQNACQAAARSMLTQRGNRQALWMPAQAVPFDQTVQSQLPVPFFAASERTPSLYWQYTGRPAHLCGPF